MEVCNLLRLRVIMVGQTRCLYLASRMGTRCLEPRLGCTDLLVCCMARLKIFDSLQTITVDEYSMMMTYVEQLDLPSIPEGVLTDRSSLDDKHPCSRSHLPHLMGSTRH
jgi:hypothetical protein